MNGALRLPAFGGGEYIVFGGPYGERPALTYGVNCAKEIKLPSEVKIPIVDFSTPEYHDLMHGLKLTVSAIAQGKAVYVGCMGGRGRTGLFLSALAKLWRIKNPVHYVRLEYYPHAVETSSQYEYIQRLRFPWWLKMRVILAKTNGWVGGELTRIPIGVFYAWDRIRRGKGSYSSFGI